MSDNKTSWIWNPSGDGAGNDPIPGSDEETRQISPNPGGTVTDMTDDSESTQYYRRESAEDGGPDAIEPVVGWFVIVKGPGLGRCVNIGPGRSSIGRGEDQRVSLPFGDRAMSRDHAQIVYDPGSRRFVLAEGKGTGLTKVDGELLIGNAKLAGGELIDLGDATQVRFVPFCGEHFDWSDVASEEKDAT